MRKAGAVSKLFYIVEPLHFGHFGGLALKLIYCLFGLAAGILSMTGFFVYWKRTEHKLAVRPPARTLLIRWTAIIGGALTLLAIVSIYVGGTYPSITVSVVTVLWLTWLVGRYASRALRGAHGSKAARNA